MIQIVKTPTANIFFDLIKNADKEIVLCAPFIKENIVSEILKITRNKLNVTIITASNISNFIQKSSDLEAIKKLLQNGITVFNYQDLHSKIYLFDSSKALITSANLTYSGMHHNYEYGVLIDKNEEIMKQIESDFIDMLDNKMSGEFKLDNLESLEKTVKRIRKSVYQIEEIDGDNILVVGNKNILLENMSPWQRDIFNVVSELMNNKFELRDIYKYESNLYKLHPSNKHIKEKIRQILQQLRDKGLIKFTRLGHYKKLFLIEK